MLSTEVRRESVEEVPRRSIRWEQTFPCQHKARKRFQAAQADLRTRVNEASSAQPRSLVRRKPAARTASEKWVAVKELNLNYHIMDIQQLHGFWNFWIMASYGKFLNSNQKETIVRKLRHITRAVRFSHK